MRWGITWNLMILFVGGCVGSTSLTDTIAGKFSGSDTLPPSILAPTKQSKIVGTDVTLIWEGRSGAAYYIVEITRQPDGKAVSGSPFKIESDGTNPPPTSLKLSLPEDGEYQWSVKSNVANSASSSNFYAFQDAVYVYCSSADSACGIGEGVGVSDNPLQDIETAINLADSLGISEVRVAARGSGSEYTVRLTLKEGVNLTGGYSPDFKTKDSTTYETILTSTDPFTISGINIAKSTTLSGFTLKNTATSLDAHTLTFQYCTKNLTISDNIIYAGTGATTLRNAVAFVYTAAVLKNNTIYGGKGVASGYAVYLNNSLATVIANKIYTAGGSTTARTVYIQDATPTINKNTFLNNGVSGTFHIIYSKNSTPVIKNNILDIDGTCTNCALVSNEGSNAIISNNLFRMGFGSTSDVGSALQNTAASHARITNNIFVAPAILSPASGTSFFYAITDADSTSLSESIENNLYYIPGISSETKKTFYRVSSGFSACTGGGDGDTSNATCSVDETETLNHWYGGGDKARGNIEQPATTGRPFQNFPKFIDTTSTDNTGSDAILKVSGGATCAEYVTGEYLEWNRDGVPRQITACNPTTPIEITISPALTSSAQNLKGREIRYWASTTSFTMDFHLFQNLMTSQRWYNIIYGGVNTSNAACGSGSGTMGAGTSSCGTINNDFESTPRTTGWPSGNDPNNLSSNKVCGDGSGSGNNCSNPRSTSSPVEIARPSGVSIGPYEKD